LTAKSRSICSSAVKILFPVAARQKVCPKKFPVVATSREVESEFSRGVLDALRRSWTQTQGEEKATNPWVEDGGNDAVHAGNRTHREKL
jgi:hypothetical protein